MSKNLKSRPKRAQMHPEGTPESIQDQRCDPRMPEELSRRRPNTRTAPKRPTKLQKYQILKGKLMVLRKSIKFL